MISASSLRQRLAGTKLPADPTDVITLPGSESWPASLREQLEAPLTPAGVLIPMFDRGDSGLSVLLTQRSAELTHHAGQISFPGGRMEPDDADIGVTALREAHEEVGIAPEQVSVIGYLEPMPTVTGYAVTPVVGLVDATIKPEIDRTEVERSEAGLPPASRSFSSIAGWSRINRSSRRLGAASASSEVARVIVEKTGRTRPRRKT